VAEGVQLVLAIVGKRVASELVLFRCAAMVVSLQ